MAVLTQRFANDISHWPPLAMGRLAEPLVQFLSKVDRDLRSAGFVAHDIVVSVGYQGVGRASRSFTWSCRSMRTGPGEQVDAVRLVGTLRFKQTGHPRCREKCRRHAIRTKCLPREAVLQ